MQLATNASRSTFAGGPNAVQRDHARSLNVRLDTSSSMTAKERTKLAQAGALLEKALANPEFERALKAEFGNVRGGQIYARLRSGREALSRTKDGEVDLRIGLFDPRNKPSWRRKIALSSSGRSLIQLNRALLASRDTAKVARTLGHMMAFKFGYDGKVPEVLGRITERLARAQPTPSPTPTPPTGPSVPTGPTVPTTTPSGPASAKEIDAIITGFRQTTEGNCVAIAAIKAGMARFGIDGVVKRLERSGAGYDVVMRDGYKVRVTDAELKTATSMSDIRGKNASLTDKANLLYAAMAKRAQQEGNDRRRNMTYAQACNSLNDGENYLEGAKWLGLEKHVKKIRASDMDEYPSAIVASSRHAMFSSGKYIDHYGTKRSAASGGAFRDGRGRLLTGAYAIV